ncbi:MAG: cation diffusion facilitator family transporter [Bacteroidales bacterium]|nr:cation diffusion facilitator family transporter [Bacteroidales bacterium]MCF8387917.1 cation diffusion facilitator family transporter [Bacteroidales bacterium]MCF8396973.1 cation diffusion facilitator family transporter [Bacteroidales bacterium]
MHIHLKAGNNEKKESRNLFITVLLNMVISVAEIIGGLLSNSLALISDALHNFSDGVAVLITYIAVRVSKRQSTERKTFGYKRIQILAAFFNSVVLIGICVFLLYEAYQRFLEPEPVKSIPMFVVAVIGLIANFVAVFLLRGHSKSNINIKAAYLHLIGDTLSSVAVIVGGILIYFFDVYWVDPLITVLISIYIIKETISVLMETYNILMQGTPKNINLKEIQRRIEKIQEISGIHHVHAWNLSDKEIHFEAHIDLKKDLRLSESEKVLLKVKEMLNRRFGITHVTLQMEYDFCHDKEMIHNGDV